MYHMSCLEARFKVQEKMIDRETEQLMNGTPDTSFKAVSRIALQMVRSCVLSKCSRCGRLDYQVEAETGLCLVCVGKELEC